MCMIFKDTPAFVGIDPGKTSGAMAIIYPDGSVVFQQHTAPLCYRDTLANLGEQYQLRVTIERLFARPGKFSSAKSNFELGRSCGELETMLSMMNIGFQAVTPQKWQKEYGISGDKETHITMARQLFPVVSLRRTEKCTKDFDGYADALLMAEWGRRHL